MNPTYFGIISFPFEFGVMFGDIGHGGMVLLFSILLMIFPDQITWMGFGAFTKIRYMLCLMGVFATFMGLMYNDFMSIPL